MVTRNDFGGVVRCDERPGCRTVAAWGQIATRIWASLRSALTARIWAVSPALESKGSGVEGIGSAAHRKTNMFGTCLRGADLRGVDLSEVEGLTIYQLKRAIVDRRTRLPREMVN